MKKQLFLKLATVIALIGITAGSYSFKSETKLKLHIAKVKPVYPGTYVGTFFDDDYPCAYFKLYVDPSNNTVVNGFIVPANTS